MSFEKTLNYLIADISAVHRAELEKSLIATGLHSGQIFILFELWNRNGLSQIDLAKNLNLSPPTINKLVKGLKDSGHIESRRSLDDARVVNVYLTLKGERVKPEIEFIWTRLEEKVTGNLTETEKLIFFQLMEKVLLNFYNAGETQ